LILLFLFANICIILLFNLVLLLDFDISIIFAFEDSSAIIIILYKSVSSCESEFIIIGSVMIVSFGMIINFPLLNLEKCNEIILFSSSFINLLI